MFRSQQQSFGSIDKLTATIDPDTAMYPPFKWPSLERHTTAPLVQTHILGKSDQKLQWASTAEQTSLHSRGMKVEFQYLRIAAVANACTVGVDRDRGAQ